MKKLLLLSIIIMFLLPSFLSADEFEIGVSISPFSTVKSTQASNHEETYGIQSSFFQDNVLGLHLGYSFAWLFYASIDANIMPAWWIRENTQYEKDGNIIQGIYAPGFVTYCDVGIRPTFGPIMVLFELGINYLYIHSDYLKEDEAAAGRTGFNMRFGAGYQFGALSVSLIGTSTYLEFDVLTSTLKGVVDGNQQSIDRLMDSIIPSVALYLHL